MSERVFTTKAINAESHVLHSPTGGLSVDKVPAGEREERGVILVTSKTLINSPLKRVWGREGRRERKRGGGREENWVGCRRQRMRERGRGRKGRMREGGGRGRR